MLFGLAACVPYAHIWRNRCLSKIASVWLKMHTRLAPCSFAVSSCFKFYNSFHKELPCGSLPVFTWGDVQTPIRRITRRHSLSPQSFTRTPFGLSCDCLTCSKCGTGEIQAYQVPYKQLTTDLESALPPAVLHPCSPKQKKTILTACRFGMAS